MRRVVVEREFSEPMNLEALQELVDSKDWRFETNGVTLEQSVLARGPGPMGEALVQI